MAEKILEVKNLTINFKTPNGILKAVRDVSFDLEKGETLVIVGESGSGKSVTNRAVMGILAGNGFIERGEILYRNQDLTKLSEENFHKIRGNKIGMIFQDPLSALNPIMRIGKQITEAMLVNGNRIKNRYLDLFHHEYHEYLNKVSEIKFVEDKAKGKILLINDNDELTNEEKRAQVAEVKAETKAKVAELSVDLPPLKKAYTDKKAEAKAIVKEEEAQIKAERSAALEEVKAKIAKELPPVQEKYQAAKAKGKEERAKVVAEFKEKISKIDTSEAKAKVVEEYKVKLAAAESPQMAKEIKTDRKRALSAVNDPKRAVIAERKEALAAVKAKVDEAKKAVEDVRNQFNDTKEFYDRKFRVTKQEAYEKAIQIMTEVGIPEPEKRYTQYPFQFSGGMRQRIVIATALVANPELLICDEPTTALDVTIQNQILRLIKNIKDEHDLSVIFITHDLGVVANVADKVAVMYAGKIVEYGTKEDIFYNPKHPYTWALLSSVPDLDTTQRLLSIPGTPPDMLFPPKGDAFADRNKYALKIDFEEHPPFFKVSDTHFAATWLLHPDAPKVEMPEIIAERTQKYRDEIAARGTDSESK